MTEVIEFDGAYVSTENVIAVEATYKKDIGAKTFSQALRVVWKNGASKTFFCSDPNHVARKFIRHMQMN